MIGQQDVIYFVVTDRFHDGDPGNNLGADPRRATAYHGGDFKGIVAKIPYLKRLGITALWITPVYLSIGRLADGAEGYHGYWALDFEKVDPHLFTPVAGRESGSMVYLRTLSDALHRRGIKLILDMVVNHTGYHNATYRDYDGTLPESWFNIGGTGEVKGELAGLPDLDHDQADVRDFFVNNVIDWIEAAGIDGIRMDTVKHVEDAFWYYFKAYVKGKHRSVTLIGEVLDEHSIPVISRYQTRHDFDTLFDFPLRSRILDTLVRGGPMTLLARPRLSSSELPGILDLDTEFYANANRLVTLLDNHDLAGRIRTEIRSAWEHADREWIDRILKLCLTFQMTTRGIPQIYYGTEIGMEGGRDPDNRRDMAWEVFDGDSSSSDGTPGRPEVLEIFEHTRRLIRIRRENEALTVGYLFTLYVDHFVYVFLREFRGNTVVVAINNGRLDMPVPLPVDIGANIHVPSRIKANLEGRLLRNLLDPKEAIRCSEGRIQVQLPGKAAGVYRLAPSTGRRKKAGAATGDVRPRRPPARRRPAAGRPPETAV